MTGGRLTIERARSIGGTFRAPSDKSLTHRAHMFGAIATAPSVVRMPLRGEDCEATLRILSQLGLKSEWLSPSEIRLVPPSEWIQPDSPLDCGNSGTTMRLLAGLLASRPLDVTMIGDASLSRRPMKRIAEPLRRMGAMLEGDTPPLRIKGGSLKGIDYDSPVASAQIKSSALLAGLRADGATSVTEPVKSRDHTERMLRALGVDIWLASEMKLDEPGMSNPHIERVQHLKSRNGVVLSPGPVNPFEFTVPGDISSAAFLMVAACLLPSAEPVLAQGVGVNPTRTGLLHVLSRAGLEVELQNERKELGEPVADISIRRTNGSKPFEIEGDLVPMLIDEIPILAVLATQCEGTCVVKDAAELRVKESDRIEVMAAGLRRMGAQVETFDDGMAITGPTPLSGISVDAQHDHRIAMSFAIAGLIAEGTTTIDGADSITTSYPDFEETLRRLAHF